MSVTCGRLTISHLGDIDNHVRLFMKQLGGESVKFAFKIQGLGVDSLVRFKIDTHLKVARFEKEGG